AQVLSDENHRSVVRRTSSLPQSFRLYREDGAANEDAGGNQNAGGSDGKDAGGPLAHGGRIIHWPAGALLRADWASRNLSPGASGDGRAPGPGAAGQADQTGAAIIAGGGGFLAQTFQQG